MSSPPLREIDDDADDDGVVVVLDLCDNSDEGYVEECLKADEEPVIADIDADSVSTGVEDCVPFKESNKSPVE